MLSLIICSRNKTTDPRLLKNIQSTIGTEYEIVHIDNSEGKYGICSAYNEGVKRSKGDVLCFMHEDIIYHNEGWGKSVEKILSNPQIGILGVAGSQIVLDKMDWRMYEIVHNPTYLIQGNTSIEPNPMYFILHKGDYVKRPLVNGPMQVATVDGVWMCMRKELFRFIRFDDKHFRGFHLYDSDICMQVNMRKLDIVITDKIILEHRSIGSYSDSFCDALLIFGKKWSSSLPVMIGAKLDENEICCVQTLAKHELDKHVTLEKKKSEIRELLDKEKKKIRHRNFTQEECKIMDESAYVCRKGFVKDKNIKFTEVKKMIYDYWKLPFAKHKVKLLWKYFWYRICIGVFK